MPITQEEFRDFSSNIFSRLSSIETKLDNIKEDNNQIKHDLYGNGDDGLIIQVDRLEQIQKRYKWTTQTIISACISTIIVVIARLVFKW